MTHLYISPETTLRHGDLAVTLAPAAGGRITRLASTRGNETIDWLVPLGDDARAAGFESTAWPKAGCYPLVPFSNRIRHGQIAWGERKAQLPLHPGERHALHGGAQQMAWTLSQQGAHTATMHYLHERGQHGWPWSFAAEQVVTLDPQGLTLALRVTNTDNAEMPCGAGFHPYFPSRFAQQLQFHAQAVWAPDADFLATPPAPVTAADNYATPRALADLELTQYYGGWNGQATMASDSGPAIHMVADAVLSQLVLHRPAGRGYFCVEPVSHAANAAHMHPDRADTGWKILAPGETLACSMALRLSL